MMTGVFSTYVEMILLDPLEKGIYSRVLHVCGDDPTTVQDVHNWIACSPRMWR